MEKSIELKKVFGEVYLRLEIMPGNAYVNAQWEGTQSVETVMQGGYQIIDMLKECGCSKLLNSNKNVIGSWDLALEWAQNVWAPQARAAGLRNLALVVPTSIFAATTIENLIQRIDDEFEIRTFDSDAEAEAWLLSLK